MRRPVLDRSRFYTVFAAEFAHPIVVQNGHIRGHVKVALAGHKFPDKVVARFNHRLGLANVPGSDNRAVN